MKHLHNFVSIVVLACVVNGDVNQVQTKSYTPQPPSKTFLPPLLDEAVSLDNEIFQNERLKKLTTIQTSTISPPVTVEASNPEQNPSLNAELQSNVQIDSSDPAEQNYEDPTTNGTNSTSNLDVNEPLVPTLNSYIIDNNNMPLDRFSLSAQSIVSDTTTSYQSSGVLSEEDQTEQNLSFTTTSGTNSTSNLDVNEPLVTTLNSYIKDNNNMPLDRFSLSAQSIVSDTPTLYQSSGVLSEEDQTEPTYTREQQNLSFTTEQPIQLQQFSIPLATQTNNDPPPSQSEQNSTSVTHQESPSSMLPMSSLKLGQESQESGVLIEEQSELNAKTMPSQENQNQTLIQTTQLTYKGLQQTETASYDDDSSIVPLQSIQQPYPDPEPNFRYIDPASIQSDQEYQEAPIQQSTTDAKATTRIQGPSLIETTQQSYTALPQKESPSYDELSPIPSLQPAQQLSSVPESETDSNAYLTGQGYLPPRGVQPGQDFYSTPFKQSQIDAQPTTSQETALQMNKDLQQTESLPYDEFRPTPNLQNTQTNAAPEPKTESIAYTTGQRNQSPTSIQADLKTFEAPLNVTQINANATSQNQSSPFIQTTEALLQTQSASLPEYSVGNAQISSEVSGHHAESYYNAEFQKPKTLSSILVAKQSVNTPSVDLQYVQQPVSTSFQQTESNAKINIAPLQYVQQAHGTPVQRTMPPLSPLDFTTNQQYGYIPQQPESGPISTNNIYVLLPTQQQINTNSQSNTFPGKQTSSHVNSNLEHLRVAQQTVSAAYTTSQGYSIIGSIETNQQLQMAADQQSHLIFTSPTTEQNIQQTNTPTFQEPTRQSYSYNLPAYSNPEFQNYNAPLQNPQTLYNQPILQTLSYNYDGSYLIPQNTQALKNSPPITVSDQYFSNAHASQETGTKYAKNGGYFYNR